MRRIHTILALAAAAQMFASGKAENANIITQGNHKNGLGIGGTAFRSMGENPMFMPSRSQRVKNKIRARQKAS